MNNHIWRLRRKARSAVVAIGATALLTVGLVAATASRADSGTGCDFAPNGSTFSCVGPLAGSTFAGGDGNLLTNPTTYGTTDWQNVSGLHTGIDKPSGQTDDAFGQGTKEDNSSATIVDGSIPPNKSDLTRFYEAADVVSGGDTYLYLGWERSNVLGSANMDFEINQQSTAFPSSGPVAIQRSPGDLLVTFDFTNGGGRPVLGLLRWLTSATTPAVAGFSTNACYSANAFPCWGDHITLNGSDSEGAVNSDAVTDPALAAGSNSLQALTFGETAIDLTQAGVFGTGSCTTFATTFLKSRASASFTAEVKDFVAPIPTSISNCGEVKIVKHTDPGGIDQNFSYSSSLAGAQISCTPDTSPSSFVLNDKSATTNTEDCTNVPFGNYTVTETQAANFVLESLTCSSGGSQDGTTPLQADIGLTVANSPITCTYVNKQQLGAIKIVKDSSKPAATPLAGATFSVTDSNGNPITGSPVTTGTDGTACVDHLPYGTYNVKELTAPSGYAIDDPNSEPVTVSANSTCGDGNEASKTFTDTPLTDVQVKATSEVSGGTQSTITCVDSGNNNIGDSPQGPTDPVSVTANGLKPGTYTCTVVVDP